MTTDRERVEALGTFLAGCVDGAVDELAAEILASPAMRDLLAEAKADAVKDFRHWIVRNRAYNGSDHLHGQSLYNECVNGALATWAEAWSRETTKEPADD